MLASCRSPLLRSSPPGRGSVPRILVAPACRLGVAAGAPSPSSSSRRVASSAAAKKAAAGVLAGEKKKGSAKGKDGAEVAGGDHHFGLAFSLWLMKQARRREPPPNP